MLQTIEFTVDESNKRYKILCPCSACKDGKVGWNKTNQYLNWKDHLCVKVFSLFFKILSNIKQNLWNKAISLQMPFKNYNKLVITVVPSP